MTKFRPGPKGTDRHSHDVRPRQRPFHAWLHRLDCRIHHDKHDSRRQTRTRPGRRLDRHAPVATGLGRSRIQNTSPWAAVRLKVGRKTTPSGALELSPHPPCRVALAARRDQSPRTNPDRGVSGAAISDRRLRARALPGAIKKSRGLPGRSLLRGAAGRVGWLSRLLLWPAVSDPPNRAAGIVRNQ
jgi:hypothetical protein